VSATSVAPRRFERNGYHVETWLRDGFNFLAVSEIPASELAQFAVIFRTKQR
jgi:anti-sigma factor RsiW